MCEYLNFSGTSTVLDQHVLSTYYRNPVKGIINTTIAIPQGELSLVSALDAILFSLLTKSIIGIAEIILSMQEGFQNMPRLWGSEVRPPGKVNNFSDGVKEGAKGYVLSYYDTIKGVFMEPVKGAKKEVRFQHFCTKLLLSSY